MSNKKLSEQLRWYIEHSRLNEMSMVEIDYESIEEAVDALGKLERERDECERQYQEAMDKVIELQACVDRYREALELQ